MKPHFGQSDAAMNKLAGCNSFPNAGKTFDLTELEQKAREAGFDTPFQMMAAKNRTEHMTPEPLPKGYFGHEDGCDCAVCENMYFRELYLKRKAADLEEIKRLAYQAGFDAAMGPDFDPVKERDAAYDLGYREGYNAAVYFAGGLINEQKPKELTSALAELVWRLKL